MIGGLVLNLVLAGIALAMRIVEWHSLNFNWKTESRDRTCGRSSDCTRFDYIADMVFTAVLLVIVLIGRYGPKQRLGVHVDSVVWYFLVAIWIPIYIVIYWGPVLVGTQQ